MEPKLELKVNQKINRMELVKARAAMRTKRRIAEQIEVQELKKLENQFTVQNLQEKPEPELVVTPVLEPAPKPLSQMNKAELLELASEKGIVPPESATNRQLVALIKQAE